MPFETSFPVSKPWGTRNYDQRTSVCGKSSRAEQGKWGSVGVELWWHHRWHHKCFQSTPRHPYWPKMEIWLICKLHGSKSISQNHNLKPFSQNHNLNSKVEFSFIVTERDKKMPSTFVCNQTVSERTVLIAVFPLSLPGLDRASSVLPWGQRPYFWPDENLGPKRANWG